MYLLVFSIQIVYSKSLISDNAQYAACIRNALSLDYFVKYIDKVRNEHIIVTEEPVF